MPPKLKTTWLVIGDGAAAQFYSINAIPLRITQVPAGALKATHKMTHGAAHKSESRHIAHVGNGAGDHQRHEDVFVEHVVEALDAAARKGEFDDFIVVLPPKALAHFRKVVKPDVRKRIKQEIRGEWMKLGIPEIERHLAAHLP